MSMSVKLFVKKTGGSDEVELRRIAIDEDVAACYDYLMAKIRATVPSASHAAIRLFWKDEEDEMISLSGDDELVEALGHVTDGVLKLYVELSDVTPTCPVDRHLQPHQLIGALSSLLSGFAACGNARQAGAGSGSGKADSADSRSKTSDQATEREKLDDEETCHDVRRLFVDTVNAFLEPIGLELVDRRRHSCDEEPAAGARMTSSQDQRAQAGTTDCGDRHAAADATTGTTATGPLNELMSALQLDPQTGSWLSNLVLQHACQLAQVLATASPSSDASTG